MQEQQAVNRVTRENCSSPFHFVHFTALSALLPIPTVTLEMRLRPHGITVNVVPITAVFPRLPRYSSRPHYRADLYTTLQSALLTFIQETGGDHASSASHR